MVLPILIEPSENVDPFFHSLGMFANFTTLLQKDMFLLGASGNCKKN